MTNFKRNEKVALEKKAQKLKEYVTSQSTDETKYRLYSPWGHRLQLAKVIARGVTSPIMKFDTDLTEENLNHIESELKKYFENDEEE